MFIKCTVTRLAFLVVVLVVNLAEGQTEQTGNLVSVVPVDSTKSVMGEVTRENQTHIELMDLKSGQLRIFQKSDLKTVRRDITERTAIESAGLPNYLGWRLKKVLPVTTTGHIAQIDSEIIIVTLGKNTGVEVGSQLAVYRDGLEIKDPFSGQLLGNQRRKVTILETTEVLDNFCKTKPVGNLEPDVEIGDVVEPVTVNNTIAVFPLVNIDGAETEVTKRISEELITGLVKSGISVVERRLLASVLGELELQKGKAFDEARAQQIGKQLGAYGVLIGTVSPKNKFAEAQLRFVRVDSGEILIAASQTIREGAGIAVGKSPERSSRKLALLAEDSLEGWKTLAPWDKPAWEVADGVLTAIGPGPVLATEKTFDDFDLHLEFLLPPDTNTGVYLRGRYEVQLLDAPPPVPKNQWLGSIWGQIAPSKLVYAGSNQWNSLDVRLEGRVVTVVMNGELIIDHQTINNITQGAIDDRESEPGPIAIQPLKRGSGAKFRNITIKPLD